MKKEAFERPLRSAFLPNKRGPGGHEGSALSNPLETATVGCVAREVAVDKTERTQGEQPELLAGL